MRLKTFFIGAVYLAAAGFGVFSPGTARSLGKPGAIVVLVTGDVRIKPDGEGEFREMRVNDLLYVGDTIRTGPQSLASIILKSGAEVRMNEDTVFRVYPKGGAREMSTLTEGQIWTRMLHKMARLDVSTLAAICAVRGTEADIKQRGALTVKVYEGHVDVSNRLGKQTLSAGEMTSVSGPRAAPVPSVRMVAGQVGNWQKAAEVKGIEVFLARIMPDAGDEKKLLLMVGKDGKSKNVEIKLKRKNQ